MYVAVGALFTVCGGGGGGVLKESSIGIRCIIEHYRTAKVWQKSLTGCLSCSHYSMNVDITESGLYNNITTVVIPNLTTVPRLLNWF